jgi:hypothetical protein
MLARIPPVPGTVDSFTLGGLVLATVAAAPFGAGCGTTTDRPQRPAGVFVETARGSSGGSRPRSTTRLPSR